MKDKVEVGYYSAAVNDKSIMVSVVTSASTVLLPRASYYVDKGMMDEFSRILKKTMHFIFLVAIPFSIYFMIYAKEGIFFLSGKAYAGAIIPMQIIMPTLTLIGISNVTGIQMMVPLGREKQVLYSEIAGAIVDLVLNTIFIPIYGAAGAALGTLVAEAVVLGWQCVAIQRPENGNISEASIWKDSYRSRTWKCCIFLGKITRNQCISNACDICSLLFRRVWNCDDGIERFFGN